jgi:hypothetical protein
MSKKKVIIPEIPQNVKDKFLKEILLSPDDIQQSVIHDKTFQHDALQKLVLRGFIEWQRSPCIEHHPEVTHEICSRCRRIAWESLK